MTEKLPHVLQRRGRGKREAPRRHDAGNRKRPNMAKTAMATRKNVAILIIMVS
ncbi:MAG: hypothetical protein AAF914_06440 [Pseudomonadota bacterium]